MELKEVISCLDSWAPEKYAEDFDNVGLLVGDDKKEVNKILVSFDVTPEVVAEAKEEQTDLIVCFHPLIFRGLKKITTQDRTASMLIDLIKNDISVYAIHTNLDNIENGPNKEISNQIGLRETEILIPKGNELYKLVFFVPIADEEKVKKAVYDAGAGYIGNYSNCSFSVSGVGSFRAEKGANPTLGEIGQIHFEKEKRVEVIVPEIFLSRVVVAMKKAHPYEEVAYDLIKLENKSDNIGMGRIGNFEKKMKGEDFLKHLKKVFQLKTLRHSSPIPEEISRVAVLGGSGAFAIQTAKAKGAQVLVSADFKYHDFFEGEKGFMICDVGHYESEQWNKILIKNYLSEKFPNFAVSISRINTNSVNYY